MKRQFISGIILVAVLSLFWGNNASGQSETVAQMIEGAKKEGQLVIYLPSPISKSGFEEIVAAFSEKYGLNLDIKHIRGGSMSRDTAKLVTEVKTGNPPSWDVHAMVESNAVKQHQYGIIEPFDWVGVFGLDPKLVQEGTGNAALLFTQEMVAPAYNPNLVLPADVPQTWDDLLDPKWKGKIAVNNGTNHWVRLSQVWGEEKTTAFLRRLSQQEPLLGRTPEIPVKVQIGEAAIAATMQTCFIAKAKKTGAPLKWAMAINPVIVQWHSVAVAKGTKRPNAARLFAAFLAGEGRLVYDKWYGSGLMTDTGHINEQITRNKQHAVLSSEFADKLEELEKKYKKILGFP